METGGCIADARIIMLLQYAVLRPVIMMGPGLRGCEYISDLILRSAPCARLEGWPRVRKLRSSFETLASQAAQDEVGDIFTTSFAGTT